MKGGMEIQVAKKLAYGKEEIIFKNNNIEDRILSDQLELFSEIIIDIYFENERTHEKQQSSKCSWKTNPLPL